MCAALWARETGGTKQWPLYDIAANADASVTVDPALAEALEARTSALPTS